MEITTCISIKFKACGIFGTALTCPNVRLLQHANLVMKPLVISAKANTRTDSAKIQNRRHKKKFNGTATKPRLSVFCSDKQLYATLIDDQNKKCLFYGNTLQKSICTDSSCTTAEAAERVGEELIKTCLDLEINEISSYDRNGLARGERMQAFEIAIRRHGFLPRYHCDILFPTLIHLPGEGLFWNFLLMNFIMAFRHTEKNVAETGLNLLLKMMIRNQVLEKLEAGISSLQNQTDHINLRGDYLV